MSRSHLHLKQFNVPCRLRAWRNPVKHVMLASVNFEGATLSFGCYAGKIVSELVKIKAVKFKQFKRDPVKAEELLFSF